MTFLFTEDGRDDDVVRKFRRYREYVESARDSFPASAYALAASDWYFNPEDHRSPHDAWLSSLHLTVFRERHEIRVLSLRLRLLEAYHDGYIELLILCVRISAEPWWMARWVIATGAMTNSEYQTKVDSFMKSSGAALEAKVVG